jgi:hypothetical protein
VTDQEAMAVAVKRNLPLILGIDAVLLATGAGVYLVTQNWMWAIGVVIAGTLAGGLHVYRQIIAARDEAKRDIVQ